MLNLVFFSTKEPRFYRLKISDRLTEEIEYGRDNAFSRHAYSMVVGYEFDSGAIGTEAKFWLFSVRCVKD